LLKSLETTGRAYSAEKEIEGRFVSPEWYLITITTQQYFFSLKTYFNLVKSLNHGLFQKNIDQLIKEKNILLAAQLTDRWVEFANKFANCFSLLQGFVEDCYQLKQVKDLPWVDINFDAGKSDVTLFNKEAADKLVYLLPILTQLQLSDRDLPDYFGQAYTFGVESCYKACFDNDQDRFKKIFPSVFFGALAAYESTRKQVEDWTEQSKIIFSTEPIEDLLCLSGYAKLYAELHQASELWKVCEDTWNNYLVMPEARQIIGLIAATAIYRDGQYVLMPKVTLRTNWDMKFRGKLQELGLARDPTTEHLNGRRVASNHPSPLIRVVSTYGGILGPNSRDIFFATYLSQHPAAEGIDLPDKRNLKQRLQREANRQQDHPEGYEGDPE
jgi:hypothetical protein